jgi:hypothetical protein
MSEINEPIVNWVIFAMLIPLIVGTVLALPAWWKRSPTFGNLLGSFAIALVIFVLIWQQYGAFIRAQTDCAQLWVPDCATVTGVSQYTPYLVLVLLGWVDVFFLLVISGLVECATYP